MKSSIDAQNIVFADLFSSSPLYSANTGIINSLCIKVMWRTVEYWKKNLP